jgi:hypothetical protein
MADGVQHGTSSLLPASDLARSLALDTAPNGIRFASFGETKVADSELERIVQAVPAAIAPALADSAFYFVPLAIPDTASRSTGTLVSPIFTPELSDEAICHRNVQVPAIADLPAHQAVFISARLLRDQFALAFELFINVGHLFAESAGIPEDFSTLAWKQALADVRGETSQDAFESRTQALVAGPARIDEKARTEFFEAAFADAVAIYLLSLAVDFDYAELREREYPLLAPNALADRLRLMAKLFPPNPHYEFSIRYRRR